MRYCVKCGRQVEDSMNFCPSCGAQIPKEETHHTYEYGNGQYTQNQTEQRDFREQTVKEEGTDRQSAGSACIFGTAGVCANFVGK